MEGYDEEQVEFVEDRLQEFSDACEARGVHPKVFHSQLALRLVCSAMAMVDRDWDALIDSEGVYEVAGKTVGFVFDELSAKAEDAAEAPKRRREGGPTDAQLEGVRKARRDVKAIIVDMNGRGFGRGAANAMIVFAVAESYVKWARENDDGPPRPLTTDDYKAVSDAAIDAMKDEIACIRERQIAETN